MPRCNNCGNERSFVHSVEGTQTRIYDEGSQFYRTDDEDLQTTGGVFCTECDSDDVIFDV